MSKRMWAALLAVAICIVALPAAVAHASDTRIARCNLRLRAKASTESDPLATIPGGTEITVLGTSGSWTKTTYNGHTGYISTSYLVEKTQSGYYPLKEGDNSPYVQELQQQLITLGYLTGSASGKYDAATTSAVKSFQAENGISQDGMAGGQTQSVLYGDTAKGTGGQTAQTDTPQADATTGSSTLPTPSASILRKGSRGEDVKTLQRRLIELGYLSGGADGVFGNATEKAVLSFQKRSSLSADGKAGTVTQNLLYSTSAIKADGTVSGNAATVEDNTATNTATDTYDTLKRGMTNDNVKKLQARLKELGYFSSNTTGYYGSVTLAAVEAFQKAHSLTADGVAGQDTQRLLFGTTANQAGDSGSATDTKTYETLKPGMKSTAVTTMQKKLKELGYFSASTTGLYGSITKEAVIAFQRANGLTADGVAGGATLNALYGGVAKAAGASSGGTGKISGPSSSSVRLLHWFDSVKPSLKSGSTLQVYDPSTGYSWNLRALSLGRHCDAEPVTRQDTETMNTAFGGGKPTWTPKVVYVKLPNGTWTMATTHNTPHLSGNIKDNGFDGHLCVHFLRSMDEATKNDPNYGVQNQKVLREAWRSLTGQTIN